MKEVCSTKISKKKSKPGVEYPFIRLSKDYLHLVGENVRIYEINHDNSLSFLIKIDNGVEQPEFFIDIPTRLEKLETELSELKNKVNSCNTPGRIRTAVAGSKVLIKSKHLQFAPQIETIECHDIIEPVIFTKEDLELFLRKSTNGLARVSIQPIHQIAGYIWDYLNGKIDPHSLQNLSDFYINKYPSHSARHKCFIYTRLFLKHLYKSRMDARILSYHSLFEEPKNKKAQKILTTRIIVNEDINSVISAIRSDNTLPEFKRENYQALILFLAYSGQRVVTASRLRREQFIESLSSNPPILTVKADQDKNRLEHLVPLHPSLIPYLEHLTAADTNGRNALFDYIGLQRWLKLHPITMKYIKGKIELKDIRKYFEQKSDEIGFTDANKNFIMSHGVSSVNWQSYKQFLPENVYKIYMKYWGNVNFDNFLFDVNSCDC